VIAHLKSGRPNVSEASTTEMHDDGLTARQNAVVREAKILGGHTEFGIEWLAMPSATSKKFTDA